MDESDQAHCPENGKIRSSIRSFRVYTPTADDLKLVQEINSTKCPRRYCWWWHSLEFNWDLEPSKGCTFLESEKPPGTFFPDCPCKRISPEKDGFDHYEPRDPHIAEDGVDSTKWLS